jgi:hypothetical protein
MSKPLAPFLEVSFRGRQLTILGDTLFDKIKKKLYNKTERNNTIVQSVWGLKPRRPTKVSELDIM